MKEFVQDEQDAYHVIVGSFNANPLGGSAPAELYVNHMDFDSEHIGVGVLRKFR